MTDPKSQNNWWKRCYQDTIFHLAMWRFSLARSENPLAKHTSQILDLLGVPRPALILTRKN